MRTQSKRFNAARTQVDRLRAYPALAAFELVKQVASTKFNETVDVAVNLGVDPRHADQMARPFASPSSPRARRSARHARPVPTSSAATNSLSGSRKASWNSMPPSQPPT